MPIHQSSRAIIMMIDQEMLALSITTTMKSKLGVFGITHLGISYRTKY